MKRISAIGNEKSTVTTVTTVDRVKSAGLIFLWFMCVRFTPNKCISGHPHSDMSLQVDDAKSKKLDQDCLTCSIRPAASVLHLKYKCFGQWVLNIDSIRPKSNLALHAKLSQFYQYICVGCRYCQSDWTCSTHGIFGISAPLWICRQIHNSTIQRRLVHWYELCSLSTQPLERSSPFL